MRIHGRKKNADGTLSWVTIDTEKGGDQDSVYVLWLIQVLKMNTLESPFWPDWGVPMWQALQNTYYPDSSLAKIQSDFSQYFAYLSITRVPSASDIAYSISLITKSGSQATFQVAQ